MHPRRFADDAGGPALLLDHRLELFVLFLQLARLKAFADEQVQILETDRFGDVFSSAQFHGLDRRLNRPLTGQHDDLGFAAAILELPEQFQTRHAGHHHVQDNHVEGSLIGHDKRLFRVGTLADVIAATGVETDHVFAQLVVVVDKHQIDCLFYFFRISFHLPIPPTYAVTPAEFANCAIPHSSVCQSLAGTTHGCLLADWRFAPIYFLSSFQDAFHTAPKAGSTIIRDRTVRVTRQKRRWNEIPRLEYSIHRAIRSSGASVRCVGTRQGTDSCESARPARRGTAFASRSTPVGHRQPRGPIPVDFPWPSLMPVQPAIPETSNDVVAFLQRPDAYPHCPRTVELRETHISWVFLAGRFAYKLKKPVRFDFLDFSSCQRRQTACDAELRLNRRFSPSVYRAVLPVCRQKTGRLSIGGTGEVIDWLVKMRRLDDHRTLDALLKGQSPLRDLRSHVRAVATHLARFYAIQAPLTVRTSAFRENLRNHVNDNQCQLLKISAAENDTIRRVHGAQKRFLVTHQDVFDDRVRDGRIVDGHGDLRPEHIYLYGTPLVIDCVEFNADYRTNDIADELAFLAMECDRLGDCSVGGELFAAYHAVSNDLPPPRLIAFYKAYRACVRAKVAALRSQQQPSQEAERSLRVEHDYLHLAERYTSDIEPRLILMVGGWMGTGKSTLATELGQLLSAEVISSDVVRQRRPEVEEDRHDGPRYGAGKYSPTARLANYHSLIAEASAALKRNNVVVLDATFCQTAMRDLAVQFASACGAKPLQVECKCPREIAIARIKDRVIAGGSDSEAVPAFYDLQVAEAESPLSSVPLMNVDTTLALGQQIAIVLKQVRNAMQ